MTDPLILHMDARRAGELDMDFQCVVTSPPYFGLNDHGDDPDEIGIRQSLHEFTGSMVKVGRALRGCLNLRGLWWLNIGDTFNGSGGAGGDYSKGNKKDGRRLYKQGATGVEGSQQLMVPFRVAQALQADGWLVRKVIVWDNGRLRPEAISHVRRPMISHEYIFMLARQRDYIYHHEAHGQHDIERGDVWHFPPSKKPKNDLNVMPFPDELARRAILLSTVPGQLVLDPFAGTGTTVRVADELGRSGVGLDLYANDRSPLMDANADP